MKLEERLEALAGRLAEREAAHADGVARAWEVARALHARIAPALDRYHARLDAAGAGHLAVSLSPPRTDDKHAHAVQLDLSRGRYEAIVTVKDRGEVTLVGPFRAGQKEGPCQTLPIDARDEIDSALAAFLERFLEAAASP